MRRHLREFPRADEPVPLRGLHGRALRPGDDDRRGRLLRGLDHVRVHGRPLRVELLLRRAQRPRRAQVRRAPRSRLLRGLPARVRVFPDVRVGHRVAAAPRALQRHDGRGQGGDPGARAARGAAEGHGRHRGDVERGNDRRAGARRLPRGAEPRPPPASALPLRAAERRRRGARARRRGRPRALAPGAAPPDRLRGRPRRRRRRRGAEGAGREGRSGRRRRGAEGAGRGARDVAPRRAARVLGAHRPLLPPVLFRHLLRRVLPSLVHRAARPRRPRDVGRRRRHRHVDHGRLQRFFPVRALPEARGPRGARAALSRVDRGPPPASRGRDAFFGRANNGNSSRSPRR